MGRYLRLDDFKLTPKEPTPIPPQKRKNTYYCGKCERYHYIYSDIGNDHRDYKITKAEDSWH